MKRTGFFCLYLILLLRTNAQENKLTVEKIMRDPKWIGSSPSNPQWSADGNTLFFMWNPDQAPADSLYYISRTNHVPVKASPEQKANFIAGDDLVYNNLRTAVTYSRNGDIYYKDLKTGRIKRITQTTENEFGPRFSFGGTKIVYIRNQNMYAWDLAGGETIQLTNVRTSESGTGTARAGTAVGASNAQENWLRNDQLQYFQVLRERKQKREASEAYNKTIPKEKELRTINLEDKSLAGMTVSPDGRFVHFRLTKAGPPSKNTIVPSYVTETGFTTDINARTKVGSGQPAQELYVYDRIKDTIYSFKTDSIPGITDAPDYVADYPKPTEKKKPANRAIGFITLSWSPDGGTAMAEIWSQDNKDRWLMQLDTSNGRFRLVDRQRDEAWIGGPGTNRFGGNNSGWINDQIFWFRSETSGYSHLYTFNVLTYEKKAITKGLYEVQQASLSSDKKYFYISTNEIHPGEQHFYRISLADGKKEKITSLTGSNQVAISPDEKTLAILYSYSNKPWELFLQENRAGAKTEQITNKAMSDEFKSYPWRDPELITFKASDGADVYARVYKPNHPAVSKPAVLFVHGAGYLQNAHKWWSSYFREYMFNNLLADNGYYVMDIDYRGSAGYGRDWRTGIYRYMGGKDLSDNVDAVNFLVKTYGVNPANIGLYGGSYGGFITLMAMFTKPEIFKSGAALRPVTDWANYNHGYTANILNEPFNDSLAYRRSSPLYYAEGLKGHLLICHGMLDVNVHYQDAVKLTQRLIELGKDNWELASYPMEDHGFVEPSSWTDEYKRIFKLFETTLKN